MRVQTRILQAICEWKRPVEGKEFGSVGCCDRTGVSDSVELERGWSVGGLHRHFLVANLDAHRLGRVDVARMFQKTGWSKRWYSRIVRTARTLGRIAMPCSHRQSEMERTIKDCWGGWSVDFHFSTFAPQRKEIGRLRSSFDGTPGIRKWEAQTTCDLGWRLQCELVYGMTDSFHVEESIPRPRTLVDTNDSLRARALHTMVTELDLTVTNVDECRHRTRAFHKIQLVKSPRLVDTNEFHHDFEKTGNETCACSGLRWVQGGSQIGACCPFVETENEIHEEERCEPAWLGARRLMAQSGCRDTDGMGELECDGASAIGNGKDSQKIGNQGDASEQS